MTTASLRTLAVAVSCALTEAELEITSLHGLFSGNVFVDPLLMPIVLTIVATILKGLISGIVSLVFGLKASGFLYFTGRLWIEAGYNALTAPFLFALLNLLKVFKQSEKVGP